MVSVVSFTSGAFTSTKQANGLLLQETITSNRFFNPLKWSSLSTEMSEKTIP